MAKTLRDFDLVALVEVVAGAGGAQAVSRLSDELNRTGNKWDYVISDPTTGTPGSSERYAFLWKTASLVKIGTAWLDTVFANEIEREPFFCEFKSGTRHFTVGAFHAVPKSKQPETEIKYFRYYPENYPSHTLIFCGDFNCPQSHSVFGPIRQLNYEAALTGCKTSLRMKEANGECLASEYDNIFFPSSVKLKSAGVVSFHVPFASLTDARRISDHLPVYLEFE
jgi:deoxyribonuclease-1-like protein